MRIFHNSQQEFFRTPFGAVKCGSNVILRLLVQGERSDFKVFVRLWQENEEKLVQMHKTGFADNSFIYEASFVVPENPQLLWYYFAVQFGGRSIYYCNNGDFLGGEGIMCDFPGNSYQITVYSKSFSPPKWLREGVMYQIFTDRFYRPGAVIKKDRGYFIHEHWYGCPRHDLLDRYGKQANRDFFGGNIWGIIEKLPYLKALGVTILYLNPIFDAYSNHKYDTGDYGHVDEMFGGDAAFDALCKKAGSMGIKVILDGVFSHTGSDSRYFNKENRYNSIGAYQSQNSPYYDWFRFEDYPGEYDCWWGVKTLPNVNEEESSYMDYIIRGEDSIVKQWIRKGAAGWRLDVADELPESFLKALYNAVKEENPDSAVIGEVWEDASNKVSYGELREYLLGADMDSVINYPFRDSLLDFLTGKANSAMLGRKIMSLFENYPKEVFYSLMNGIGSHDVPRVLTVLGGAPDYKTLDLDAQKAYKMGENERKTAKKRLKLAVLIQFLMPGMPFIYYGDEAGLEGMGDPFNRRCYPWGREDREILAWYRRIIKIRHEYPVLKTGEFKILPQGEDVFVFLRYNKNGADAFGEPAEDSLMLAAVNSNPHESRQINADLSEYGVTRLKGIIEPFEAICADGIFSFSLEALGFTLLAGFGG